MKMERNFASKARYRSGSLVLLCLLLSGCALLKASPVKETVFIPKPELAKEQPKRAPFNRYWVFEENQYYDLRKRYARVYIAPVDTQYAIKLYEMASGEDASKTDRIQETEQLARYFREKLKLSLKGQNGGLVEIVDQPGPDTLTINLALTQVVPTNPGVNLAGTIAGVFVPGGGLLKYFGEGSVAMEGYVVDQQPMDIYEQYADREGQKTSPFSLKDYQRYAHIRVAIDDWSMQIAELLNTPPDHTVEESLPVSLNPL